MCIMCITVHFIYVSTAFKFKTIPTATGRHDTSFRGLKLYILYTRVIKFGLGILFV